MMTAMTESLGVLLLGLAAVSARVLQQAGLCRKAIFGQL
jgi:hypothetical protein